MEDVLGAGVRKQPAVAEVDTEDEAPQVETRTY